jgi:hypothetical protein
MTTMMTDNRASIRPKLDSIDSEIKTLDLETFQNETLRPILKLQNDLIIAYFNNYLNSKKIELFKVDKTKIEGFIKNIILKDQKLSSDLKIFVIAHFTVDEYNVYHFNYKEFNKRITTMLSQRINSNYNQ